MAQGRECLMRVVLWLERNDLQPLRGTDRREWGAGAAGTTRQLDRVHPGRNDRTLAWRPAATTTTLRRSAFATGCVGRRCPAAPASATSTGERYGRGIRFPAKIPHDTIQS